MDAGWTLNLVAIIAVAFVLQNLIGAWDSLAFVPSKAFSQPWTFVTSIFMHADISHLLFNAFALFLFGSYLESRVDAKTYIAVFLSAGIVGNLGYMATATNLNIPGIGASGAVYGIMGALAVLMPNARIYMWFVPMPMILAAFFWAASEAIGLFFPSNIARGAHLGGLFLGILYGLYLRSKYRKVKRRYAVEYSYW